MAIATLVLAASAAALAAWTDWRTGRIPNWLTFGAAGIGLVLSVLPGILARDVGQALIALLIALLGALLCSAIPLLLFWKGGMGGGDVKLFAALGIICLPELGLLIQTYTFIAALALAPAWLLYRGALVRTLRQAWTVVTNPFRRKDKRTAIASEDLAWFRLGPAIFLGTVLAVFRASLLF
jgi:prepilin peptidase CpaA